MILAPRDVEILHGHLYCGLGGGARGFNRGRAEVGNTRAKFRCVGGIDIDKAAIADFDKIAGVKGTVLDLFSREQYVAFHGCEPPSGWREATPADIRRAWGGERPHIGFGSAPCKGFSGLLSEAKSKSMKYDALNQLAIRGLWLALEAYKDDPLEFWLWENVPRIATRGRVILDQMIALLEGYGYAVAETTHDCGELGGLGQHRKRFLLVARHREKVPPFLYEPPKRRVRSVGEVIGAFPVPGAVAELPMHRLPMLQWQTWVRLAFVKAGGDWRSLNELRVADGVLRDYALIPAVNWNRGVLGVRHWDDASGVVTGRANPTCGTFAVADPRSGYTGEYSQIGVREWQKPAGVVSGQMQPGGGPHSIADPRYVSFGDHYGKMRVEDFDQPAHVITGSDRVGSGALSVADPRLHPGEDFGQYGVNDWQQSGATVTSQRAPGQGRFSVADPRITGRPRFNHVFRIVPWSETAPTIAGAGGSGGGLIVADPREPMGDAMPTALPNPKDRLVAVIQALDGTYHRPFTTLELAALQSLVDPDEVLELVGQSDSAWRERIGNAVPPAAAEAIASVMGQTLLLAWAGETFMLSATPIWVQPIVIALSVRPFDEETLR